MRLTREHETCSSLFFFFQAEDGIRDLYVTGVQTCALPISTASPRGRHRRDRRTGPTPCGRAMQRGKVDTTGPLAAQGTAAHWRGIGRPRSEERRVGKECRCRGSPDHQEKKELMTRRWRTRE